MHPSASGPPLCEGMTATIEGLVSRADLNGKHTTLLTFTDGRWGTRLVDGSESVRVKPVSYTHLTLPTILLV